MTSPAVTLFFHLMDAMSAAARSRPRPWNAWRFRAAQTPAAAAHYQAAIANLERFIAAHPENVEAAADLRNARRGLEETIR